MQLFFILFAVAIIWETLYLTTGNFTEDSLCHIYCNVCNLRFQIEVKNAVLLCPSGHKNIVKARYL